MRYTFCGIAVTFSRAPTEKCCCVEGSPPSIPTLCYLLIQAYGELQHRPIIAVPDTRYVGKGKDHNEKTKQTKPPVMRACLPWQKIFPNYKILHPSLPKLILLKNLSFFIE